MTKYYFKNPTRAYAFQELLQQAGIDSQLVNELQRHAYSIKLDDSANEIVADQLYGRFLLQ